MQQRYYNGINVFKFISAFVIAQIYHYGILFGNVPLSSSGLVRYLNKYGFFLVEFFFVISGFFTMKTLSKSNGDKGISIKTFMSNKLLRLYPQIFFSVVFVLVGQLITIGIFERPFIVVGTDNIVLSLILSLMCVNCGWISNHDTTSLNGPTWYVSILFICYLITAIIYKICRSNKRRVIACALVVFIGIEMHVFDTNFPLAYSSCSRGYMSFFMGMLLYSFVNNFFVQKYITLVKASMLVLIATVIGFVIAGYELNTLIVAVVFAPSVICLLVMPNLVDDKIPSKVSKKLGELSYSLYLMNIPAVVIIKLVLAKMNYSPDYSRIDVWLTITLFTLFLSIMANDIFEKRFVNRFIKNRSKR